MNKNIIILFLCIFPLFTNIYAMEIITIVDTPDVAEEIESFVGILDVTTPYFLISSGKELFRADMINPDNIWIGHDWLSPTTGKINDIAVIQHPYYPAVIVAEEEPDTGFIISVGDTGTDWGYYEYLPVEGIVKVFREFGNDMGYMNYVCALSEKGIFVYDLTNTTNPTLASSYTISANNPKDVAASGNKAYTLVDTAAFVFDKILETDSIFLFGKISLDSNMNCLDIGSYLIFVGGKNQFSVFLDDSGYLKITEIPVNGNITDIMFDTTTENLYIGVSKISDTDFQGIMVYNVDDFTDIKFLDSCSTPGGVREMIIEGEYLFATLGNEGTAIIDNTIPTENINYYPQSKTNKNTTYFTYHLLNKKLKVIYTLKKAAHISINIISPNGRTVRSIFKGTRQKGRHLSFWDFRDNNGNPVPSGIYYINLHINGYNFTESFIKF